MIYGFWTLESEVTINKDGNIKIFARNFCHTKKRHQEFRKTDFNRKIFLGISKCRVIWSTFEFYGSGKSQEILLCVFRPLKYFVASLAKKPLLPQQLYQILEIASIVCSIKLSDHHHERFSCCSKAIGEKWKNAPHKKNLHL